VYHKLSEPSRGSTEPYNVYGVISDATYPYVKNKCLCSVKLIDDSLNAKCARQIEIGVATGQGGYFKGNSKLKGAGTAGQGSMTNIQM
jgi:hypothetical protein